MFERYTEKARRVIFFARYEASQFGSPYIETEHMLLGILREDKRLTNRFLRSHASVESIRKQIEARTTIREKVSTSVDLPISNEGKRVLTFAAEEAERLSHPHIGTEHLLLGLMREEKCFAAELLKERGVQLDTLREQFAQLAPELATPVATAPGQVTGLFQDLSRAATDGLLEPVIARSLELDCVFEILSRRDRKNPILIGQHGAGKTSIVEALAQRIADGEVPPCLAGKRVMAIGWPEFLSTWTKWKQIDDFLKESGGVANPADVILFVDGLRLLAPSKAGILDLGAALNFKFSSSEVQCICAGIASDFREATNAVPRLGDFFCAVHVRPLDQANTLIALQNRKVRLEKFHEVTYSDEALEFAVQSSDSYLSESSLPGKALDLLDAAGALMKLRQFPAAPAEILDVQKRIKFITNRLESASANHEFEKARFYSDEERKERENLRALKERLGPEASSSAIVGKEEVAAVIARWSTYPYSS
ncbi:MAG: Clp protease N-terminal domain-containing protein [Terracidiphilus sp.]